MSERTENVFNGTPDERQAADIRTSRFRPRYRALTVEEKTLRDAIKAKKTLRDAIKAKADELMVLFEQVNAGRYRSLGIMALEEAVMWTVKELTA